MAKQKGLKKKNARITNAHKALKFFIMGLFGTALLASPLLWSQEIDPFYLKLLNEGEKSYLEKNYRGAVKDLEITIFGLHGQKKLLGKAYVYLSLSYRHLNNREKCEEYLRKAFELVGQEGFKDLEIDQSTRDDLKILLDYFKIGKEEEPEKEESEKVTKEPQKRLPRVRPKTKYEELEERIKAEPQNLTLYYELYEFHREKNDVKAARKVIQDLIKNNPDELIGPYLMGKIEFSQSNYAAALRSFNQVLKPFEMIQAENVMVVKSLIYVTFCLYHLDRKELHESFVKLVKDNTTDEHLRQMLKEEELEKEWDEIIKEEKDETGQAKMEEGSGLQIQDYREIRII